MSQSRRLARSSPRDNQQRLIAMHHRRPLLRVERLKKRGNFRCFGRLHNGTLFKMDHEQQKEYVAQS